jgi:hypothetical protein
MILISLCKLNEKYLKIELKILKGGVDKR